jgi:hypothetical protein
MSYEDGKNQNAQPNAQAPGKKSKYQKPVILVSSRCSERDFDYFFGDLFKENTGK